MRESRLTMTETILESTIARAEFHRTRLDPSAASRVRFVIADMTSFSFPTKFDLVIGPYFALNHLPHRSAVLRTFKRVAEHLVTGGAFALHVANVARLARSLEQETTSKILDSRRFNRSNCICCPSQRLRGSIPHWRGSSQGLAAVRDFDPANDGFGSSASDRHPRRVRRMSACTSDSRTCALH
jgi:hypothetical protein